MNRLVKILEQCVYVAAAILITLLLSAVLVQIVCRNLFNFSFVQLEELCILMLSWLAFLAATYAMRHCAHVAVDFFYNKMPKPVRYILNIITLAALILLMMFLAYHGYGLAMRQMRTPLPVTHIPRGFIYMSVPVSSAVMVIFLISALLECIRDKKIAGVVVDMNDQIEQELENGVQLAEEVLR